MTPLELESVVEDVLMLLVKLWQIKHPEGVQVPQVPTTADPTKKDDSRST